MRISEMVITLFRSQSSEYRDEALGTLEYFRVIIFQSDGAGECDSVSTLSFVGLAALLAMLLFFLLFDIFLFESGTTGSRTNQAASFPTPAATA